MFCTSCGCVVPDGSSFCGQCGHRLTAVHNSTAVPVNPTPPVPPVPPKPPTPAQSTSTSFDPVAALRRFFAPPERRLQSLMWSPVTILIGILLTVMTVMTVVAFFDYGPDFLTPYFLPSALSSETMDFISAFGVIILIFITIAMVFITIGIWTFIAGGFSRLIRARNGCVALQSGLVILAMSSALTWLYEFVVYQSAFEVYTQQIRQRARVAETDRDIERLTRQLESMQEDTITAMITLTIVIAAVACYFCMLAFFIGRLRHNINVIIDSPSVLYGGGEAVAVISFIMAFLMIYHVVGNNDFLGLATLPPFLDYTGIAVLIAIGFFAIHYNIVIDRLDIES